MAVLNVIRIDYSVSIRRPPRDFYLWIFLTANTQSASSLARAQQLLSLGSLNPILRARIAGLNLASSINRSPKLNSRRLSPEPPGTWILSETGGDDDYLDYTTHLLIEGREYFEKGKLTAIINQFVWHLLAQSFGLSETQVNLNNEKVNLKMSLT